MTSHLTVLCWDCHVPLDGDGLQVWMKPDDPFSNSTTRLCEACFTARYPNGADQENP